jgi:hypothetical protein
MGWEHQYTSSDGTVKCNQVWSGHQIVRTWRQLCQPRSLINQD